MRLLRPVSLHTVLLLISGLAFSQGIGPITTSVGQAKKREGTPPTVSAQGFKLRLLVNKDFPLENPSGDVTSFGELSTGVGTEPDQNTYLVLPSNPVVPNQDVTMVAIFCFKDMKTARTWHM